MESPLIIELMPPKSFPGLPKDWSTSVETFDSADSKVKLSGYLHASKDFSRGKGRGIFLIVLHGMGEHGGRYAHFPHYLHKDVDAIYCIDHRGHGRSEGIRGHAENFDLLVNDSAMLTKNLFARLKENFPEGQLHLFGHSMGGQITIRMLLQHPELPLNSVTVSAPLMGIAMKVPPLKDFAAKVLSKAWGSLQLPTGLDTSHLSHDPEVKKNVDSDPLCHDKMSPLFFTSMREAFINTLSYERGIEPPIQALVPLGDLIVDPQTTLQFFEKLKHSHKRIITYPDFYHESFNELGKEKAFEDLAAWIRENPSSPVY